VLLSLFNKSFMPGDAIQTQISIEIDMRIFACRREKESFGNTHYKHEK
jgi:hypothetical protein